MLPIQYGSFSLNSIGLNSIYAGISASIANLSSNVLIANAAQYTGMDSAEQFLRNSVAENREYADNVDEGICLVSTTADAVEIIGEKINRMKQLAQNAASGQYTAQEVSQMQTEFDGLITEIDELAAKTTPGDNFMLTKDNDSVNISIATGISIDVETMDLTVTGLGIINNIDLSADPDAVLGGLETAAGQVDDYAGHLNSQADTLDISAGVLDAQSKSLLTTQSVIESADAAMMAISALNNAFTAQSVFFLAIQANSATQIAMQLLTD